MKKTPVTPIDDHDDDKPVGRVLTRREVLAMFGAMGGGLVALTGLSKLSALQIGSATPEVTATALPSCIVRPELTEGPYFVENDLNRSDLRMMADGSLKAGALLKLIFNVSDVTDGACTPLKDTRVDVWHCDALGVYSGVNDPGFNTTDDKWLRGCQDTDEFGVAEFTTIYPGWYSGRAVHIHFKIRTDPDSDTGYEFTSQFFFDEELTDQVHAEAPYASKGYRNVLNEEDGIFQGSDGLLTLDVTEDEDGYTATFGIGLDFNQETQAETGGGGFPGGPGGAPGQGGAGGGRPPQGGRPGNPPPTEETTS